MYAQDFGERNYSDLKRWSNGMIGKVFYRKDPKNPNRYQTVRIGWNAFANKMIPQYSNFVEGVPPDHLTEINPRLLSSLATMQPNTPEFR